MDFGELALTARDPLTHGSITPGFGDDAVTNTEGEKKKKNRKKKRDNGAMAFLSPSPITLVTSGAWRGPIQNKHAVFI